jgi:hypothetical protein
MKRSKMVPLVLALVSILGFYGIAFGEGGEPGPSCPQSLPPPNSGPFIFGSFTVALDKSQCGIDFPECANYVMHAQLTKRGTVHLFSYNTPGLSGRNLCSYTVSELKELYKRVPCLLDVGQAFGLQGMPVIAELVILKKDFCTIGADNPALVGFPEVPVNAMISGAVVIRVVP